ncbi:MAG: type I 3-dehydroquinate dehydratase [Acidobacteria bacterium]|nr:type I 3-dehydroquinate dehydratase [Acidobacteriota bacterium]
MGKATLIATLADPFSESGAWPDCVEWLEVRADLAGDLDPDQLRRHFKGRLLYTLRSGEEGGAFAGTSDERRRRLSDAARRYDFVDLEGERDCLPDLLDEIPPARRVISWHGVVPDAAALREKFERLSAHEAFLYRLVTTPSKASEALVPLLTLKALGRADVVAYAEGDVGSWSRLVAPRLGAPFVFAAAEGGFNVSKLIEDYGLPALPDCEEIYGIVGNPVMQSLSPRLHNAAYRALNHPALFVPFHVEEFGEFWREAVKSRALEELGLRVKGLTVVSPHKEAALAAARKHTPMTRAAGSTNLFVSNGGEWEADTSDSDCVVIALRERGIAAEGLKAAVIGCGGAGRAVAAGLTRAGAKVTLVNRGAARGRYAVELLGLPFAPLSEFSGRGFALIVNATPVGRDDLRTPFDLSGLEEDAVVVDLAYGSEPTPLVVGTRARGRLAVDGREVLLIQVQHQFQRMTGFVMPVGPALEELGGGADARELLAT